MSNGSPGDYFRRISAAVFDLFLLFSVYVFITGAAGLIPDAALPLISQRPWIHRLGITALLMLAFLFFLVLRITGRSGDISPLTTALKRIPLASSHWLWILFILTAASWTFSSWVRHETLQSGFDMAIFSQALWNGLESGILYSSIKGGIPVLGDHFSPFLYLLVLPYSLWTDPRCLLLVQALAAASAIFPLYLLARDALRKNSLGLVFAVSLCLYLPLRNAVRFEFHPELVVTPLCLWAFYFLKKSRLGISSLFLVLILSSKETGTYVAFAMGVYAFFFERKRLFGIFWMLFSAAYFIAVVFVVIPAISGQEYFYLGGNVLSWKNRGMAAFLKHTLSPSSVIYIIKILGPLGFLSLLHPPTFILTLPSFFQNLFSLNPSVRSIFFQYTAYLTPFVYVSAIYGASRFRSAAFLPYYVTACALLFTGVSEYYIADSFTRTGQLEARHVSAYLQALPPELSVRTNEFLSPHAAHRRELHIYENTHPKEGGSEKALNSDVVAIMSSMIEGPIQEHQIHLENRGYQLTYSHKGFYVFSKRAG